MANHGTKDYSYDVVPYPDQSFQQTHPDRLATLGTLFGMQPATVDACRVLEIGSASGRNLIPLADQLPKSRFIGIELGAVQVAEAERLIRMVGLKNVEIRHCNILDLTPEFGVFDYIICHGVFSWVDDQVQNKILEICSSNLAPQGIAYISYNTFPGWHMRGMIRDMMCYHAGRFAEPAQKIGQARALIDFLAKSTEGHESAYGMMLSAELALLQRVSDAYLFHDHLEEVNDPIYFHQFIEIAVSKGLQYLGEVDLASMWRGNFPETVAATLDQISGDIIEMEQYTDFVCNRTFRQTLLCRDNIKIDRNLVPDRLTRLNVASALRPNDSTDFANNESLEFVNPRTHQKVTTTDALLKAALMELVDEWPAVVPFDDVVRRAWRRIGEHTVVEKGRMDSYGERIANWMLQCYASGLVEVSVSGSRFTTRVNERPLASKVARVQAEGGNAVTNRPHQMVELDDLSRQVLRFLDGQHDKSDLLDSLADLVADGALVLRSDEKIVTSREEVIDHLRQPLDEALKKIASAALLIVDD